MYSCTQILWFQLQKNKGPTEDLIEFKLGLLYLREPSLNTNTNTQIHVTTCPATSAQRKPVSKPVVCALGVCRCAHLPRWADVHTAVRFVAKFVLHYAICIICNLLNVCVLQFIFYRLTLLGECGRMSTVLKNLHRLQSCNSQLLHISLHIAHTLHLDFRFAHGSKVVPLGQMSPMQCCLQTQLRRDPIAPPW